MLRPASLNDPLTRYVTAADYHLRDIAAHYGRYRPLSSALRVNTPAVFSPVYSASNRTSIINNPLVVSPSHPGPETAAEKRRISSQLIYGTATPTQKKECSSSMRRGIDEMRFGNFLFRWPRGPQLWGLLPSRRTSRISWQPMGC